MQLKPKHPAGAVHRPKEQLAVVGSVRTWLSVSTRRWTTISGRVCWVLMESREVGEPGQRVSVSLKTATEQRECGNRICNSKDPSCVDIYWAPEGQWICRLFLPVGRNRMWVQESFCQRDGWAQQGHREPLWTWGRLYLDPSRFSGEGN